MNKFGRLILSKFKTKYKATVIKIMQCWKKNEQRDHQYRDLRNNPYKYSQNL